MSEEEVVYDNDVGEAVNNDVYQETEYSGFFSNLGDSFAGICIGLLLFIGAFPLLWWNEGRAVDAYQAIDEGRKIVVPITSASVDPINNVSSLSCIALEVSKRLVVT
jgi:hypothetical protein